MQIGLARDTTSAPNALVPSRLARGLRGSFRSSRKSFVDRFIAHKEPKDLDESFCLITQDDLQAPPTPDVRQKAQQQQLTVKTGDDLLSPRPTSVGDTSTRLSSASELADIASRFPFPPGELKTYGLQHTTDME